MTRLSHKRTLLTALLSGTLAFSPVLSTAQYAFADTPIYAMGVETEGSFIKAMAAGGTVTLDKDIDVAGDTIISNSVTLDLNGHTLTYSSSPNGIHVKGGTLSVSNGTIINDYGACITSDGGSVSISSGNYLSKQEPLVKKGDKSITLTGGTYKTVNDIENFRKYFVKKGYSAVGADGEFEIFEGTGTHRFSEISLSQDVYTYDGNPCRPEVTVRDAAGKEIDPAYYSMLYTNFIDAGIATVRVEGEGPYAGYLGEKTYTIKQAELTLSAPSYTTYIGEVSEGKEYPVTAKGLLKGDSFKTEPVAKAKLTSGNELGQKYTLVVDTDGIVIVDSAGLDVTDNYKFVTTDGLITSFDYSYLYDLYDYDYGYIDYTDLNLSNATVTLTADPAPYKSSGYRDRDNIKSVVVNGIDVTSRCNYSYSGNADPGSTVTVTITPSNTLYNNTSSYRSAATPSSSSTSSSSGVKASSISAASEEGVALSAQAENEDQIAIVANELPEIVAQAYHSGLYPSGSDYYDMLYWLMNNSAANSSYYTDLSRYLYGNFGICNLGSYIGTNGNASLLNLINRYYRGGYYGNWYNGYYNNGYYNNGNFFDYNNRTYRLTGSKTVTFKISDSNNTVTVSANNVTKRQGDPDPQLTATILGINESDKSKINYTISRVQGETPGTYAINVTGATEQNGYKITFVPGTLTITAATAGTDVAGGATTAGTGTATTPAVLPTSPAAVAATTSANKLAATGDNTFLGYGIIALVGVAAVALGVFFSHKKKNGE